MSFQQIHEIGTKEHNQRAVLARPRLRGARRLVQQRQFAEDLPGTQQGQPLRSFSLEAKDFDLAGLERRKASISR